MRNKHEPKRGGIHFPIKRSRATTAKYKKPDVRVTLLFCNDDSQRRLLAQHSVATLLRHCFEWLQHCSNIAALCCAKNRCCESSCVRLLGAIHVPQNLLYSYHVPLEIFLYVCVIESKKNPILPCGLGLKAFSFPFFRQRLLK